MSLCTDDVFRIAKLARLELDAGEAQAMLDKLNGIFGLIEKMQAVDTTGVEPLYKPQAVAQRLRDDVVTPCLDRDEVLSQAPDAVDGRFCVPAILGEAP